MNGDDPQQYARTRRVPPPGPGRPGPPPANRRQPGGEPPRRPPIEPTQVMRRDGHDQALAYSQVPPQNQPRFRRGGPPPEPMTHAPTQRPVPYREAPPPPPPSAPPRRRDRDRPPPEPRMRRKRRWGRWLLLILIILLILPIAGAIYLDRSLHRVDALSDYKDRVGDTPGTNWLLTGSDSRLGLTADQESELSTGDSQDAGGQRSDTIMLVHVPKSGKTTIVSLPRDSYVPIPGVGRDKLNAAFSAGGPKLLTQTVETVTGLHIDHFAEIGFGGFAGMVDAVGGIDMCLPDAIDDPLAGIDLPAGCQRLSGAQALGFVRTRATPRADLDRMHNQQMFLSALLKKSTDTGTLINPLRLWPLAQGLADSLQVDNGDHIWDVALLGWALRGDTVSTTVPIGGFDTVSGSGSVLLWDKEKAGRFFDALASDKAVPEDLITR
ncbi:LCP family protein required for cell wall assembly [Nocardia transvalensis]|uniref:LCP family protein required for cell wall assembly n=1 Tax=Nocardia transvalensis TaxID=37333 RepID=A0A7W9PCQ0_9NOCA|nr:LCP family protein [Nocardia transvalensis]MBB5913704.1 LCP family protein required for cell wall assembly [Nocardia transvalensis]